jgi:hypothetical protein
LIRSGGIDKSELNFDIGDCFIMCCWDLKEFDYGHYDIMANRLVKQDDIETHKSKGGISINTEVIE